jgi:hypothetical protein
VRLWDLGRPDLVPPAQVGHGAEVAALAFSADGRALASGDFAGVSRLWQVGRGLAAGAVLQGHEEVVQALAFSADGRTLATASNDGTARLWQIGRPEAKPLVLRGQGTGISAVAFSPDGATLATGDNLGRVRLWPLRTAELLRRACATVGRNMLLSEWQGAFGAAPYARTCAGLPVSPSLIEAAADLAAFGDMAGARALEQRARALGAADEIPARSWGRLCRAGSLAGGPAAVRGACEQAVALDPQDGQLYDWRALNSALAGELDGAREDLLRYVSWAREQGLDEEQIALREAWAAALASGANPFDEAALALLRSESL